MAAKYPIELKMEEIFGRTAEMMGDEVKEKTLKSQGKGGSGAGFKASRSNTKPAQDLISRKLREYYQEVVQQPVPERFSELLDELERRAGSNK
jgi:Anti-sigma factor NepR